MKFIKSLVLASMTAFIVSLRNFNSPKVSQPKPKDNNGTKALNSTAFMEVDVKPKANNGTKALNSTAFVELQQVKEVIHHDKANSAKGALAEEKLKDLGSNATAQDKSNTPSVDNPNQEIKSLGAHPKKDVVLKEQKIKPTGLTGNCKDLNGKKASSKNGGRCPNPCPEGKICKEGSFCCIYDK